MLRSLPFVVLAAGLAAQQFAPFAGRTIAEIPPARYSVVALADCDGDGDQDAAVNDPHGNLFAVLRRGVGDTWTTIGLLPGIVTAAVWADFDGDGDLDLLVGATGSQAAAPFGLMRNDGATFTWRGQAPSLLSGSVRRFAVGDLDGDLAPDVVLGTPTGVQRVRNLGNTTFGAAAVVSTLAEARPALFDRDGDGDLDLAIASPAGVALFDNALGVFTNISGTLPAGTAGVDVVANDLDGDGRVDLAFARTGTVDVAWNDPNGWQLAAAVVGAGDDVRHLLCGDLDRDGDRDLVLGSDKAADWLRNGGNRSFARLPALRHGEPWWLGALALGDAAARGAVDVVGVFMDGSVRTLYGAAPEPFLDPQALPAPAGQTGNYGGPPAVGDVDGDGRPDMIAARDREVLHDDGRGRFSRRPILGAREGYADSWLVDLDGDADLDLLLGTQTTPMPPVLPMQRFANDGLGNFTPVQDVTTSTSGNKYQFGDVDGDGDVDMLCPGTMGHVHWYQNVGNGVLVDSGTVPGAYGQNIGNALVFADLDGDGDRDIVCGMTTTNTLPVFLNTGNGVFTTGGALQLSPGTFAWDYDSADVDGDGDVDIVMVESGALVLWQNDGDAGFTRVAGAFPAFSYYPLVEFADIDEDGDLDLYTGGGGFTLLTNDGTGLFSDASARLWSPMLSSPRFVDVDEDGDNDLVGRTGNNSGWQRWLDRMRGAESLQVVRAGGGMNVRFYVQPHAPVAGAMVLPMASIGGGAATAFAGIRGKFLLQPATMVMLGMVDASSGMATTGFAIPPWPGLLGLELSMQGLVFGPGVTFGFTNVVDERILP